MSIMAEWDPSGRRRDPIHGTLEVWLEQAEGERVVAQVASRHDVDEVVASSGKLVQCRYAGIKVLLPLDWVGLFVGGFGFLDQWGKIKTTHHNTCMEKSMSMQSDCLSPPTTLRTDDRRGPHCLHQLGEGADTAR